MSYTLVESDANILHGESWERLVKFYVLNIAIGIVITIILTLIVLFFGRISLLLTILLSLGVVLSGAAFMLSSYERWRGCNIKQEYVVDKK